MKPEEKARDFKTKYDSLKIKNYISIGFNNQDSIYDVIGDRRGNLVVTTMKSSTICVLSDEYKIVTTLNKADNLFFNCMPAIRLSQDGTLLIVIDMKNSRLVSISTNDYTIKNLYYFNNNYSLYSYICGLCVDVHNNIYVAGQADGKKVMYKFDKNLSLQDTCMLNNKIGRERDNIFPLVSKEETFFLSHLTNTIYKESRGNTEIFYENSWGMMHYFVSYQEFLYITVNGVGFIKLALNGEIVYRYRDKNIVCPSGIFVSQDNVFIADRWKSRVWVLERK